MTVYAPTDVRSINVSGGCGTEHSAPDNHPNTPMSVDCDKCEPLILAANLGWANHPRGVALTPDEIAAAEDAERMAKVEQNRTWSSPQALRDALFGDRPTTAPSLLDQVKSLSDEERAVLRTILGPPTPEPDSTTTTGGAHPDATPKKATGK